MNVWEKLQNVRKLMSTAPIKKSGENKFSKYSYYTLDDLLPPLTNFLAEQKLVTTFDMNYEGATYRVINAEKPDEMVTFTCPTVMAEMKGSSKIQELGATLSYCHRYLVLLAFSICELEWVEMDREEQDRQAAERNTAQRDKKAVQEKKAVSNQKTNQPTNPVMEIPACGEYEAIKDILIPAGYSEHKIREWIIRQAQLKGVAEITTDWLFNLGSDLGKKMKKEN